MFAQSHGRDESNTEMDGVVSTLEVLSIDVALAVIETVLENK